MGDIMDIFGVIAVCIVVTIIVMSMFYYLLKDLKFDSYPTLDPKKKYR